MRISVPSSPVLKNPQCLVGILPSHWRGPAVTREVGRWHPQLCSGRHLRKPVDVSRGGEQAGGPR